MYSIKQKKFNYFERTAYVDEEKELVRFKAQRIITSEGYEVPLMDIDPQEYSYRKIPVLHSFLTILFFIATVFFLFVLNHSQPDGSILDVHEPVERIIAHLIIVVTMGVYSFIRARLGFYEIAQFNRRSTGKPCIMLYCSGEFAEEYQKFKNNLLKDIEKISQKIFFNEVIKKADTDFLINTFRHELIKELQSRGINIQELAKLISETYANSHKDNVIRLS